MPTSNTEELRRFLKCTVIGRGVFGPCACWSIINLICAEIHGLETLRYFGLSENTDNGYRLSVHKRSACFMICRWSSS